MNKQKLASFVSIALSVIFTVSFGLFFHFKVLMPKANSVYERLLYYPEALYEKYEAEAEKMIASNEYNSQYPIQTTFYSEDGRTTLIMEIGDYKDTHGYSNYLTATVKNFGTSTQEISFERSRKSAEEAQKSAESYRTLMHLLTIFFIGLFTILAVYLIYSSTKRRYFRVYLTMAMIIVGTIMVKFAISFYGIK